MISESNLALLWKKLEQLGLPDTYMLHIRLHACFDPPTFVIRYNETREGDGLRIFIPFYREGNTNDYSFKYYDAFLCKKVEMPEIEGGESMVKDIDEKMSRINWKGVLADENKTLTGGEIEALQRNINESLTALDTLKQLEGGTVVADLLKIKYWMESPFEIYCEKAGLLKNSFEVTQRFYCFEEERPITFSDAYLFLCHKWRERKIKKK